MYNLSRITLTDGLIFSVTGGETTRPFPAGKTPPASATDLVWTEDIETGDIAVTFLSPPEAEGGEQVETAVTITAAEIQTAWNNPPAVEVPAPRWSPLEFLSRFTQQEQAAIEASESITVKLVKTQLLAASEIIADDTRTVAGMSALVSEGVITQARHDAILSNI